MAMLQSSSRTLTCSRNGRVGAGQQRLPLLQVAKPRARVAPLHAVGFEPTAPGAAQLAASAVVMSSTVITGLFWWFVVVPEERAKVSKSKRKGELRQYLEELEQDESRKLERWAYTDWRNQLQKRKSLNAWGNNSGQGPAAGDANANTAAGAGTSQPGLEASTQMAATTAQAPAQAPGAGPAAEQQPQQRSQQQQPQHQASGQLQEVGSPEDDLKQPRFLSLDNPIVLTFTVLGMLAFAASLQGR